MIVAAEKQLLVCKLSCPSVTCLQISAPRDEYYDRVHYSRIQTGLTVLGADYMPEYLNLVFSSHMYSWVLSGFTATRRYHYKY